MGQELVTKKPVLHQWLAKVGPFQECTCGFWVTDAERVRGAPADRVEEIILHDQKVDS